MRIITLCIHISDKHTLSVTRVQAWKACVQLSTISFHVENVKGDSICFCIQNQNLDYQQKLITLVIYMSVMTPPSCSLYKKLNVFSLYGYT